jgi:hypothetical protein
MYLTHLSSLNSEKFECVSSDCHLLIFFTIAQFTLGFKIPYDMSCPSVCAVCGRVVTHCFLTRAVFEQPSSQTSYSVHELENHILNLRNLLLNVYS